MKWVLAILALAVAAPGAASAQRYPDNDRSSYGAGRGDQDDAREAVRGGRQVPLATVIRQIAVRVPGRQLNTTMGEYAGRLVYYVQWQTTNNQVIIFIADAQTGQIIGQQGG
jgi:uncharacterized membrane protein YkoI